MFDPASSSFVEFSKAFNVWHNNCLHKTLRIARLARANECNVRVLFCWSKTPRYLGLFQLYTPHFIPVINDIEYNWFYSAKHRNDRHIKGKRVIAENDSIIYPSKYVSTRYAFIVFKHISLWDILRVGILGLIIYGTVETFRKGVEL